MEEFFFELHILSKSRAARVDFKGGLFALPFAWLKLDILNLIHFSEFVDEELLYKFLVIKVIEYGRKLETLKKVKLKRRQDH